MRTLSRRALLLFVTALVPAALVPAALVPAALIAQRSGSTIDDARIVEATAAREGATICEIGAGSGDLSIAAARQVGSNGRVYTSELGDARLDTLKRRVADSKLPQISVVAGDATQTNFPDGACDAVFMRNVYHHFADPPAMNASIAAALKPGGRLVIVDFAPPGGEASRPEDRDQDGKHGIRADTLARELREAGFQPISSEQGSGRWYLVAVAKPAGGSW